MSGNIEPQEISIRAMEANVRDLIIETTGQMKKVSQSPQTIAKFEGAMSDYLSDLRSDLLRISSLATRCRAPAIFDDAIFQEIRRRTERHIDSCRDAFVIEAEGRETEPNKKPGPKPYDWLKATNAVWGQIYRGELIPEKQADIERALAEVERVKGDTTARPYARPIWREMGYEPED